MTVSRRPLRSVFTVLLFGLVQFVSPQVWAQLAFTQSLDEIVVPVNSSVDLTYVLTNITPVDQTFVGANTGVTPMLPYDYEIKFEVSPYSGTCSPYLVLTANGGSCSLTGTLSVVRPPSNYHYQNPYSLASIQTVVMSYYSPNGFPYLAHSVPVNLKVMEAVPYDTVDDPCNKKGSIIGCENQSLGETIPVTGTSFALHYRSDRVTGRLRADAVGVALAKDLGGWTLTPYHRYDPVENRLLLGNGERHDAAALGTVKRSPAGGYLIAYDSDNQVHEFAADGTHLQTRHTLTGATLYRFTTNAGKLAFITDAYGNVTTIQRDSNGRPTAIVAPFGQVTRITTDANGYLAQVINPAGGTIKLQSGAAGLLTSFTRTNGVSSSFDYDADGRLVRDIGPTGAVQTLSREGASVMDFTVIHTSGEGRTTRYEVSRHSSGGDDRSIVDPAGLTTTINHAAGTAADTPDGMHSGSTLGDDPRFGKTESFSSDAGASTPSGLFMMTFGKRTATLSDPNDPFSLTEQNETLTINRMPDGVELPPGLPPMLGRTYTQHFDAATRTSTLTSPSGQVKKTIIDDKGRQSQTQVAGLAPQTFAYDTRGRLARVSTGSSGDEQFVALGYDASGWLSSVTDSLGRSMQFTRDALGQVVRQQLPGGRILRFAYDADSHMTMLTVPSGAMHRFSYDRNGLLSAYAAPSVPGAKTITRYSYDLDRRLKQVSRPDGALLDYSYDTAGRLSAITTPQGEYRYAYSPTTGKLSSIDAPSSVRSAFTYDGSLLTGEAWSGAIAGSIGMAYDFEFRVQTMTLNGANPIALTYDTDGRLSAIGDLTLTRDAGNGLLTGSKLGGVEDHYDYDQFGQVTRYQASANGTVLLSRDYTYDLIGHIVGVTESSGGATIRHGYQYDAAGRLSQVTTNDAVVATYQYDANGNRTHVDRNGVSSTATFDAQDRLLSFGNATYTYTGNGELASQTRAGQTTSYGYDALGNLVSAQLPNGTAISYLVDSFNRRVGRQVGGTLTTSYLYDGPRIVAQLDSANTVVSRFIYGSNAQTPDFLLHGGNTYRIFSDHLHSPRLVVDVATGQVAERIDYDESGVVTNDTRPGFLPFGFAGGLYDFDTGLVHFGAREYFPSTGRWTSNDPILFYGGDANLYGYVLNDPLNMTDPAGLGPENFINEETLQKIEQGIRDIQQTFKVKWEEAVKMYWEADSIKSSGKADSRPGVKGWKPGSGPMLIIIVCGRQLMESIREQACYSGRGACTAEDLFQ